MGSSIGTGHAYQIPVDGDEVELSIPSPERASCVGPILVSVSSSWILEPRWKRRTGVLSRARQRLVLYEEATAPSVDGSATATLAEGESPLDLRGAEAKRCRDYVRVSLPCGRRVLLKTTKGCGARADKASLAPVRSEALLAAVVDVCAEPPATTSSVRRLAAELEGAAQPAFRSTKSLPSHLLLDADTAPEEDDAGGDVCPVCLEELWRAPVCYLSNHRRARSCTHFLHAHCARQLQKRGCPTCRAPFCRERVMPPLEFADLAWAGVLATQPDGVVQKRDVANALAAQYPFDKAQVEAALPWDTWTLDPDHPDELDAARLCDPNTGIKATVLGMGAEPSSWHARLFRRVTKPAQPPMVVSD